MEKKEFIEKFVDEEVKTRKFCTVKSFVYGIGLSPRGFGIYREIYRGRKSGIADAILKNYHDSLEEGVLVDYYEVTWENPAGQVSYRYISPEDFDPPRTLSEEEIDEAMNAVAW